MRSFILFIVLVFSVSSEALAQLDTIHWLPPLHARSSWGPQYLFLSTPEKTPFEVTIRDGEGTFVAAATISNSQPYKLNLGTTDDTKTMVPEALLHQALPDRGLVAEGEKPFYCYFRAHSDSKFQAGDLTCKGRAALGTTFRIGHLEQGADPTSSRANFIGIMATEDSTHVELSQFAPAVKFRIGGADVAQTGPIAIDLNKGETIVFSMYLGPNATVQPPNGFMGALLESSKPIAVNCGSWLGAPVTFQANDAGIDQIAPFEQVGDEYILVRGAGSAVLERPIIVAHKDNTKIFLNGSSSPVATLAAGKFFVIPTSNYSAAGNMHVKTTEPVFVYQMIGGTTDGDDQNRTAGLIFVPPLSCGIPNAVDDIFEPNAIGDMRFEGGVMVVAMKDSLVQARVDGQLVNLGAASPVAGAPDFVTYRNLALFTPSDNPTTLSVVAKGAVQVAMFGRNQPASFAAFFSGFTKTKQPRLVLERTGDGVCPDTLRATGLFDGIQWIYEDSTVQIGPDTFLVAWAPGPYVAIGFLGVCRRTDFAADTVDVDFDSPAFPYRFEEPSCYGFSDGEIAFGQPTGGAPPYEFSINNGKTFSKNSTVTGLTAGTYKLVARDSTGCYNRPLTVEIDQPDSFSVEIEPIRLPEHLKAGDLVELRGAPSRPVDRAEWLPADSTSTADFLNFSFRPSQSQWIDLTVFDSLGCPASDRLLIEVEPGVFAPNAIAPDGNSPNDRFVLYSREALPIRRILIFDRWGEKVFERTGALTNDRASGWDGQFRGQPALPGVYGWWAEVEILPGKTTLMQGDLTIIR